MLITNFAAGELSESLFGRIDIPQYFSGASRLENFNVIPTGGILRRGGTERITQLNADGRLIPFVVNRELSFILHLVPGQILVYRIVNGRIAGDPAVFNNNSVRKLYEKLDEITEVQFAQNFDVMILVHENYPPLEVNIENNNINIITFEVNFNVSIIADENLSSQDKIKFEGGDKQYNDNGWLVSDRNYPSIVSFFHGRLIFANTKNNRQRIFISKIKQPNEDYNFATKKIFLTEKKEYITIFGNLNRYDRRTVVIEYNEGIKFQKALENYFFDTPFFASDTKIVRLLGNVLITSKDALFISPLTNKIENELNDLESKSDKLDELELKNRIILYSQTTSVLEIEFFKINIFIIIGATKIKIRSETLVASSSAVFFEEEKILILPPDAVLLYEKNSNYYYNFIKEQITNNNVENSKIVDAANQLKNNSLSTMKYRFVSGDVDETIYHYGPEIKRMILRRYQDTAYLPLYTREVISDEYPTPDCGFTFEIASDLNDSIKWLSVNKGLIIGTESAEWIIPPGIHALNVQAALNSRFGSDKIQGTAVGDATCFFQTGKKALVEYHIPEQDNHFRANNMAMLSENMLRESPAKEFDFISSPYTKFFITREDGTAVTLLYERSTGTFAWGRFTTSGDIKSAAVIPGADGYDELYLLVKREEGYYLEVLHETSNVYLDSYRQWDGDRSDYSNDAVIYDELENEVYPLPAKTHLLPLVKCWIGYPYASCVRSMPILANDKMKQNNIKNLLIRFLDSFMPKLKALPNGAVDTITCEEPFTGVWKTAFPGGWNRDVMFEFIHDAPTRCKILAINAEVN